MRISLVISVILRITGSIFILLALGTGIISVSALIERMRYEPGLMFADFEFFGILALISGGLGAIMLISANKLAKRQRGN
jgi:hypothetical protein